MYKPLADKLIIEPVVAQTTTSSGLVLPESVQSKPFIATVISVGPKVLEVVPGDKVVFSRIGATELKDEDKTYLLTSELYIIAIVED